MADKNLIVIPSSLEKLIPTVDGAEGIPFIDAFKLKSNSIPNVYSLQQDGSLVYAFTESGKGYGDSENTTMLSQTKMDISKRESVTYTLHFEEKIFEKWGINFCGRVLVQHKSGEERVIFIPGTRTYDPAGITGDPHASERIGPSCSCTQTIVTIAQLFAAVKGATLDEVTQIQEATRAAILHYHGRECLFDWMRMQIEEAIFKNRDVTAYPEFIKQWVESRGISLSGNRGHTKTYLESYDQDCPHPPKEYYVKVSCKDDVGKLLSEDERQVFDKLVSPNK